MLPHLDDAYTLARYLVGDEHAAQDVTQDASLRALRYLGSFRDGNPRAWFLAIVRNCCHDWLRRERGDRSDLPLSDDVASTIPDDASADAGAIAASERARIRRAVATLSPELRETIVLREVQGLSYEEIASVLGVPIGTVMSRLSRARSRLRELMEGQHAPAPATVTPLRRAKVNMDQT